MTKQVLDVQQMQHLQELGIEMEPHGTLFSYVKFEDTDWLLKPTSDLSIIGISFSYISACSLQDVLDMLPATITHDGKLYGLMIDMVSKGICYHCLSDILTFVMFRKIPFIDAAYQLLCWAIENGFVETNKNE